MKKMKLKQEVKDAIELAFVIFILVSVVFIGLEAMRKRTHQLEQQKMTESVAMNQSLK